VISLDNSTNRCSSEPRAPTRVHGLRCPLHPLIAMMHSVDFCQFSPLVLSLPSGFAVAYDLTIDKFTDQVERDAVIVRIFLYFTIFGTVRDICYFSTIGCSSRQIAQHLRDRFPTSGPHSIHCGSTPTSAPKKSLRNSTQESAALGILSDKIDSLNRDELHFGIVRTMVGSERVACRLSRRKRVDLNTKHYRILPQLC
jgi:hypothetical protein